jgi:hypothetical protein
MTYLCPVCNGLAVIKYECSMCGQKMEDHGRFDSFLLDYSPYREIDDMKKTNNFIDLAAHQCVHVVYCPNCDIDQNVSVSEWTEAEAMSIETSYTHPSR